MNRSLIYEVNVEISDKKSREFETWLAPHIEEVLATGCFHDAQTYKRDSADPEHQGYSIHYFARSGAALEQYLKDYAPRLRADAMAHFGDAMKAHRRILRLM